MAKSGAVCTHAAGPWPDGLTRRVRLTTTNWSPRRRGFAALIGGVAGGQVLALLASPLLGRLFPPAEYGPFAVIGAAIAPLSTIAALRLELAIPLPRREGMARDVARLGLQICGCLGIAGLAVAWLARDQIATALGQGHAVAQLIPWVPVIAAEIGAFAVLNQLAIRYKAYGAIARRSLLQAAATVGAQVIFGYAGLGAQGLALGLAIGQGVGVLALAVSVSTPPGGEPTVHSSPVRILRRFRSFPLLLAPAGLLNTLGIQAPLLLASAMFGVEVSGWLGMTQRVLALPISLLGTTLAQVYLGEFGEAKRSASGRLTELFTQTSKRLALVGVAIAAPLILLGPLAFSVLLGQRWENSGSYAQALAIGLVAQMVGAPLSQTLIVMGKNLQQFVWDVGRLAGCSAAVYAGFELGWSPTATMWLLGAATAASYGCLWLMSWYAVKRVSAYPRTGAPPPSHRKEFHR